MWWMPLCLWVLALVLRGLAENAWALAPVTFTTCIGLLCNDCRAAQEGRRRVDQHRELQRAAEDMLRSRTKGTKRKLAQGAWYLLAWHQRAATDAESLERSCMHCAWCVAPRSREDGSEAASASAPGA